MFTINNLMTRLKEHFWQWLNEKISERLPKENNSTNKPKQTTTDREIPNQHTSMPDNIVQNNTSGLTTNIITEETNIDENVKTESEPVTDNTASKTNSLNEQNTPNFKKQE